MFSKPNGHADAPSGPSLMLASALRMLGITPEEINQLSTGLLVNLRTVANTQPEILARLEFLLKCTLPPEGDAHATAWEAYLTERRKEYGDGEQRRLNGDSGPAPSS